MMTEIFAETTVVESSELSRRFSVAPMMDRADQN